MGKKAKKSKKHDRTADAADAGASPPKMTRKDFEQELKQLQVELTRLQAWAVAEGARVIVVFEGRDTAGKGGVISPHHASAAARACSGMWRCRRRPTGRRASCTSSATWPTSRPRARSSCSTGRGTTGPASSG